MKTQVLKIVPREASSPSGLTLTQGTKVLTADGHEIGGVSKITLVAAVNDIWRATIECNVSLDRVPYALAEVQRRPLSPWQRICLRLAGCRTIEATSLADRTARHAKA